MPPRSPRLNPAPNLALVSGPAPPGRGAGIALGARTHRTDQPRTGSDGHAHPHPNPAPDVALVSGPPPSGREGAGIARSVGGRASLINLPPAQDATLTSTRISRPRTVWSVGHVRADQIARDPVRGRTSLTKPRTGSDGHAQSTRIPHPRRRWSIGPGPR